MNAKQLREIFGRTKGHCHFCGDSIVFENRGWCEKPSGHWEVDHVIQQDKGGPKTSENCLPACTRCNRLRWHRTGDGIRELLLLGVIAAKEIKDKTEIGKVFERLKHERLGRNIARRQQANRAVR